MTRIAIFASGSGSNAEKITEYFKDNDEIEVALIASNKSDAFVLERAKKLGVKSVVIPKKEFSSEEQVLKVLSEEGIDWVVLAGFLLLVPAYLVKAFPNKIVNIHPALLPSYGGKGMYGAKVHEAVKEAGEKETGITIHFVNDKYDEGEIIFQAKTEIVPEDSPETIAQKVHQLEYQYYPQVIEKVINNSIKNL